MPWQDTSSNSPWPDSSSPDLAIASNHLAMASSGELLSAIFFFIRWVLDPIVLPWAPEASSAYVGYIILPWRY